MRPFQMRQNSSSTFSLTKFFSGVPLFCFLVVLVSHFETRASSSCGEVFSPSPGERLGNYGLYFPWMKDHVPLRQDLLLNLHDSFQFAFRDPRFYSVLSKDPAFIQVLYERWYLRNRTYEQRLEAQDKVDAKLNSLQRQLGPDLFPLILDPGIQFRLDNFLKFVQELPAHVPRTAIAVREHYSDYLGYVKVYRGMRIHRDDIEYLKKSGFPPRGNYNSRSLLWSSFQSFAKFLTHGPMKDSLNRIYREDLDVFSQSFTKVQVLAEGFARNKVERYANSPEILPLMVTAEIPVLDLVNYKMLNGIAFSKAFLAIEHYQANDQWLWGGRDGLELLLFGPMDPRWIIDVSEIKTGSGIGSMRLLWIFKMK